MFELFQQLESGLPKELPALSYCESCRVIAPAWDFAKNSLDYSEVDAIRYSTEKELLNC